MKSLSILILFSSYSRCTCLQVYSGHESVHLLPPDKETAFVNKLLAHCIFSYIPYNNLIFNLLIGCYCPSVQLLCSVACGTCWKYLQSYNMVKSCLLNFSKSLTINYVIIDRCHLRYRKGNNTLTKGMINSDSNFDCVTKSRAQWSVFRIRKMIQESILQAVATQTFVLLE